MRVHCRQSDRRKSLLVVETSRLSLTDRAEERRAPRLRTSPDCSAATPAPAWFSLAVVDAKSRRPVLTTGLTFDRIGQNPFDRGGQPRGRLAWRAGRRGDGGRHPLWRQSRDMQRFARVDVAEASDDALIEQRDLERGPLAFACARQRERIEFIRQRLWAQRSQHRMTRQRISHDQIHESETPRIGKRDDGARRHLEDNVLVTPSA
jgi:hypothetical protein